MDEADVRLTEPAHSINARKHHREDWDPTWDVGRWSATLVCDEAACGEVVNMLGDMEVVESMEESDEGPRGYSLEEALCIRAVFPPPNMMKLSVNVPASVKAELYVAFRMYWTDTSACVARLRTAVERLLDEQKVPKIRMSATGKAGRMNLQQRIDSFASGAAHRDQLDGLRNIGNMGTHGSGDVGSEDLFDALDVLEHVLIGVYDTKSINAKAKRLSSKGKEKPLAAD